jgi:Ca2+-binding RTX toxin-like protein
MRSTLFLRSLSQPATPQPMPESDPMKLDEGFGVEGSGVGEIHINEMPTIFETQIDGTKNPDQLMGDDRSNAIYGKGGDDQLFGQGGFDVISGGGGNDRLSGGDGRDRLLGERGNDVLIGGSDNDTLYGGDGNDRLRGGSGNDILIGGDGDNVLVGGSGADGFVLSLGKDINTLMTYWNNQSKLTLTHYPLWEGINDTIVDFQDGLDKLGLPAGVSFENLEILQQGANTIVQYVKDPLLKIMPLPIATLKGIQADTVTAADFATVTVSV